MTNAKDEATIYSVFVERAEKAESDLAALRLSLSHANAENVRLRGAVEWACNVLEQMERDETLADYYRPWKKMRTELRRRAEGEG